MNRRTIIGISFLTLLLLGATPTTQPAAFVEPLADHWDVKTEAPAIVKIKTGELILDATEGNLTVTSKDAYRSGKFAIRITCDQGRCWIIGLVDKEQKNSILLRNDLPDSDDLFFELHAGDKVTRERLGPLPPDTPADVQLDWHEDGADVAIRIADREPVKRSFPADQVPRGEMRLSAGAYFHTHLTVSRLQATTAQKAGAQRYPSIWDRPTEVAKGAALRWGESAYREFWSADVPPLPPRALKIQGPTAAAATTALLADRDWRPRALLPLQDGIVPLPADAHRGMRVIVLADGTGESRLSSDLHLSLTRVESDSSSPSEVTAQRNENIEQARAMPTGWARSLRLRDPSKPLPTFKQVGDFQTSIGDAGTFVSNGQTGVGLAPPSAGAGIRSLYCLTTGRESISEVIAKPSLWRIWFRRTRGDQRQSISNVQTTVTPTVNTDLTADGALLTTLTWQSVKIDDLAGDFDVVATVRLDSGDPLPAWRIAVRNRVAGAVLDRVEYPIVDRLGYPGESDALCHSTFSMMTVGELHRRADERLNWCYLGDTESNVYPSGSFPIQHVSTSVGSDTVVYVGWHDPESRPKGYLWDAGQSFTPWVYPENSGDEGIAFESSFDTLLGPMPGDWFTAVARYREWAHRQSWCQRGPKHTWDEQARKQVCDVPFVCRPNWTIIDEKYDPRWAATITRRMRNAEQWLGMPLAVQWYGWHHCIFDANYPDYFPMVEGFAEEVRREIASGWTVMPFLNGVWYDLRTAKGTRAQAEAVASKPDGTVALPDPSRIDPVRQSSVDVLMCPSSAWWRDELCGIVQELHRQTDCNGVYLDVTANQQPTPCHNRSHPHPPGRGGAWWSRDMNAQIAAVKSRGGAPYVMSECFNEALGATVDTNLVWTPRYPFSCPMLGAVYGGWLNWWGCCVWQDMPLPQFAMLLTRETFWGGVPGTFINDWWADDNQKDMPHTRLVIDLCAFRRATLEYLSYGEMQRPPAMTSEPTWIALKGWQGEYARVIPPLEIESIERAAWLSPRGSYGLALLNYDEKVTQVRFNLASVGGLKMTSQPQVITAPAASPVEVRLEGASLTVALPPRTPVLIVCGTVQ